MRREKRGEPTTLRNWKELFAPHILPRGLAHYREGSAETLRREGDVVKAVVLDSERYWVEIDLEDGQIAG